MKKWTAVLLTLCLAFCMSHAVSAEEDPAADPTAGGWEATKDASVTEEIRTLLDKAFNGIDGTAVEPVAVLGRQTAAGTNICILCRINPVVQDPVPYYALIFICEDPEGGVQLTQIQELDLGTLASDYNG